ncbi:hypothetical protein LSH36_117g03081 [Paralvinella palmiformis]|uniref:Squalene synthase n=1 Tax=Paralvinella palmiformis TaxID=53620 RepID=A0AAD9JXX5_9ANNE|nr:hypothetical protein LSH36_117g03081 [Paralvinella palmiformis]
MEIIKHLTHPDELYALIKYKMCGYQNSPLSKESLTPTKKRCYELLNKTSRSFSAVIQKLDDELRDAVCIFYLVLRALDTVEDDMTLPEEKKIPMLKSFYKNLYDTKWCFMESNEKDKMVLEEFPVISAEFCNLSSCYQDVISDICQRMGDGMTVYLYTSPLTMADWDEYCHYVAGLVGIGLSRLFSASNLEDKIVGYDTRLANSMGLFLQKTNIIRDVLEDVQEGRFFWPKEHIPDVIKYLSRIRNPTVFQFCAIPQIRHRIPTDDPSAARTRSIITHSLELTETQEEFVSSTAYLPLYVSFSMMIAAILWQYYHGIYSIREQFNGSVE